MGEEGGEQEVDFPCEEEVRSACQRCRAGWVDGLKRFQSAGDKDGRGTDQALERGPLGTQDHYPPQ